MNLPPHGSRSAPAGPSARARSGSSRIGAGGTLVAFGVVIALLLSGGPNFAGASPASSASTLGKGPALAVTPGTFWSTDAHTNNSTGIWTDAAVRAYVNTTPFSWVRYGQNSDECNLTANVYYADNGTPIGPCAYNLTAFRSYCTSMVPRCHVVMSLPAETNNTAVTVATARYIVRTLGFAPGYWAIGDEPEVWKHFGIPWTHWKLNDSSYVTPLKYADELKVDIGAIRAVLPGAKFIGLEAANATHVTWLQTVARVDGSLLSGIAYHLYPSGPGGNETLAQFFGPLTGTQNVSSTYGLVRSDIAGQCPGCASLPIFIHEFNSGPVARPSNWRGTYANAVFLAASVVQALRANVTQLTWYELQGNRTAYGYALLTSKDAVSPIGLLASQLLSHLVRGTVYGTRFTPAIPGVWSVLTETATRATLLVVNTNLTQNATFSVGPALTKGVRAFVGSWNATAATPSWGRARLAGQYTVPPEGILLISVPASAAPTAPSAGAGGAIVPGPVAGSFLLATDRPRPGWPGPGR